MKHLEELVPRADRLDPTRYVLPWWYDPWKVILVGMALMAWAALMVLLTHVILGDLAPATAQIRGH